MQNFTENHFLLEEMYDDQYYPKFLVDKLKMVIMDMVGYLVIGGHNKDEIQEKFDEMTININNLQEEFYENDSEIETVARECIAMDIEYIINYFNLAIDVEEALREREW